jgi:hypothetical protein
MRWERERKGEICDGLYSPEFRREALNMEMEGSAVHDAMCFLLYMRNLIWQIS